MSEEEILVIKRSDLLCGDGFCGICEHTDRYFRRLSAGCFSASRSEAERCTDWKQPIPYVMVMKDKEVLTTRRTHQSGEQRLHDKLSIGIGGHMRPAAQSEMSFEQLLWRNLYRELTEELAFRPQISSATAQNHLKTVGVLNDDRDEVGRCHFGLVYILNLPQKVDVDVRETDKLQGQFRLPQSIPDNPEVTEGWSMLCLRHLREANEGRSSC